MKDVENSVIYTEDMAVLYTVQPESSVDLGSSQQPYCPNQQCNMRANNRI